MSPIHVYTVHCGRDGNHRESFEAVSDPKAVGVDVTRGKARTPFPNRLGHHRPVVSY